MRSQPKRDEQTVRLATMLGVFALAVALGAVLCWVLHSVADVDDALDQYGFVALVVTGVASAVSFDRHRFRDH